MNRISIILARIYDKIGFIKDSEFCEKYQIKKNTLSTWKKRNTIPYEVIELISQNENLSLDWLLTGKGEMFLNNEKSSNTNISELSNSYEVDVLNVRAGAGGGIYNYEVEVIDKMVLDKSFFRTKPDVKKIKIIEVDGDSMYPTFQSGDLVIIDENKTFGADGIYAIQLHGQILIKRLQFKLNGSINIISDNKEYDTQVYDTNDTQVPLNIIGMKTLTIQR